MLLGLAALAQAFSGTQAWLWSVFQAWMLFAPLLLSNPGSREEGDDADPHLLGERLGLAPPGWRDLQVFLVLGLLVLVPFVALVKQGWIPRPPGTGQWGDGLWTFPILQLTGVVLPEEFFFRGYLLASVPDQPRRLSQALWDPRLWGTSLAFALLHVVSFGGSPAALDRFFPGLWFGVARLVTGRIWVPVLLHLASNLLVFGTWL